MKKKPPKKIEKYRIKKGPRGSDRSYGNNGAFEIPGPHGILTVIISDGMLWDHVSVSTPKRTPRWSEMCFIKNIFFEKFECVIQYHPPESDYINQHSHCLHLWRSQNFKIPMPPLIMV